MKSEIKIPLPRCPQCNRKPKNMADTTIGFKYGCLCRVSMAQAKFSFDQKTAANNWNTLVEKCHKKIAYHNTTQNTVEHGEW